MSESLSQSQVKALLEPRLGRIRNVSPPALRTYNNRVYHSKAECKYAFELDALKAAGRIKDWTPQVPIQITVYGHKICKLVVDFAVTELDNSVTYHELKGMETEVWRLKVKLLKACRGDIKYLVVRV